MADIEAKVKEIIINELGVDAEKVTPEASFVEDLGADYINERNGMIEAVTVEDIARVAKRLLEPDELSFVVVGKPAGL